MVVPIAVSLLASAICSSVETVEGDVLARGGSYFGHVVVHSAGVLSIGSKSISRLVRRSVHYRAEPGGRHKGPATDQQENHTDRANHTGGLIIARKHRATSILQASSTLSWLRLGGAEASMADSAPSTFGSELPAGVAAPAGTATPKTLSGPEPYVIVSNITNATLPSEFSAQSCTNLTGSVGCTVSPQESKELLVDLGLFLVFFGGIGVYTVRTPGKFDHIKQKPVSWTARTCGLMLMWKFLIISLPWVGFLLNGCFWSSIGGLTTAITLGVICLPPYFELLDIRASLPATGLRVSACLIGSAGGSGVSCAFFIGDQMCAGTFLWLSVLLCVDCLLFGWAWWQGEGGGVMGLLRGRGIR